jgi:hypothetical protein
MMQGEQLGSTGHPFQSLELIDRGQDIWIPAGVVILISQIPVCRKLQDGGTSLMGLHNGEFEIRAEVQLGAVLDASEGASYFDAQSVARSPHGSHLVFVVSFVVLLLLRHPREDYYRGTCRQQTGSSVF